MHSKSRLLSIVAKPETLCWACRGLKRALEEANLNSDTGRAAGGSQQSSPAVHKQLPARSATTAPAEPESDAENQQPASSEVPQPTATPLLLQLVHG